MIALRSLLLPYICWKSIAEDTSDRGLSSKDLVSLKKARLVNSVVLCGSIAPVDHGVQACKIT